MAISPFHILYKAKMLSGYAYGRDKLIPAFASSDMEVYPHQVAAAMFALHSPVQKGVILCDEGGLGKSYAALLVLLQKWTAGREKVLMVIPGHLRTQWRELLDEKISVPFVFVDTNSMWDEALKKGAVNPFEQEAIVVTTYDFAVEKSDFLSQIGWDAVMFDEAGCLRKAHREEAKEARILKFAVGEAFKILLTATPMQLNIMDLFGLIYFIDETVFPDEKVYYDRYFRKPENYPELAARVSPYCFRTLRSQVTQYAKIPRRIPATVEFTYTETEQRLYKMIETYLRRPVKYAFPKMDQYELALMLYKTMSSSTAALTQTLEGVVKRLDGNEEAKSERAAVAEMLAVVEGFTNNTKTETLLKALDACFRELRKRDAAKKALIFVENRATQRYLKETLGKKYKVIVYSGDSRDENISAKFKADADILLTTDLAAEGFNFEFCSLVVHYDLAYNTLKMEQRIDRCHRINQQNDVISLSLVCRENLADVRVIELVGKRTLLMDGVFGLSDDVIGGFTTADGLQAALECARTRADIEAAFTETLQNYEAENKEAVGKAEDVLFSTFDKSAADKIHITPQYVESRIREINDDLWELLCWFFGRQQDFMINEETRTIRTFHDPAPHVFTGTRLGRSEYSMTNKTLPKSGWITIGSNITKNMLNEIFWTGLPREGSVTMNGDVVPCEIAFYEIVVRNDYFGGGSYAVFIGQDRAGNILSDKDCRKIMELPIISHSAHGESVGQKNEHLQPERPPHPFEAQIDADAYISRYAAETDAAVAEEMAKLKAVANDRKIALERGLEALRGKLAAPPSSATVAEKILAEKRRATLDRELKQKEQSLFMDSMRLDVALEEQIKEITKNMKLSAKVKRLFLITVSGGKTQ